MSAVARKRFGPALVPTAELGIELRDYDRIVPGIYPAYCRWAKHYRDPGFKRWTCLLRFVILTGDLLTVIATVPCWFPLGNGERPWASRRGKYLKEWTRANGGPPPRLDRLSPAVFRHRMAKVEVADTDLRKSPAPYSVVRRIIDWETGPPPAGHSVNKSPSQGRHQLNGAETEGCKE